MSSSAPKPVLVVCGLAAEARIAADDGVVVLTASPATLATKLDAFDGEVAAVVSFGLCGGLAPLARAGAVALADAVVSGPQTWACDPEFVRHLRIAAAQAGRAGVDGPVAGEDTPVVTAADKAVLRGYTNAVAVDTESHVAARFAAARGLPFGVVRAVCDAAARDLPPLAVRAIDPDGRLDFGTIGVELARRPGQLLQLPGTALATAVALRSLRRVRRLLGPRFGF